MHNRFIYSATIPCEDTADWNNNYGHTCAAYANNGWCSDGSFGTGYEWTGSPLQGAGTPCAAYFTASKTNCAEVYNYPADNCCACGKGEETVPTESKIDIFHHLTFFYIPPPSTSHTQIEIPAVD